MYVDEDYVENATFTFKSKIECPHDTACLEVTKDSDSIEFDGKLTNNFTEYKATLDDGSTFLFKFGTKTSQPAPPVIPHTDTPTIPAEITEQSEPQTEPSSENPNESDTSPSASNGDANNGNEQETIPTTSGSCALASALTALLVIITQFLAH